MRADTLLLVVVLVASALSAMTSAACVDPVHDQEVAALGGEQPGVPAGPLHRAGQPCLDCHGGSGPASAQFSSGGTIYQVQGESTPAVGAQVQIEDIDGNIWTATTNSAGNFFVLQSDFVPHYPTQMTVTSSDGKTSQQMSTHASRDGSCADCHASPESASSAGPVYLVPNLGDGG